MDPANPRSGNRGPGLYIQLFSVHGLIRSHRPELGRDADTGGQVKYVLELARALSAVPQVERVDLVTRRLVDGRISDDYAQPIEPISDKARIVRLDSGDKRYRRKELLWPHLDRLVEGLPSLYREQGRQPDIVHGHYADAGYVAMEVARYLRIPFVFTGHSLGRLKLEGLLSGGHRLEEIDAKYRIRHRIEVEEQVLRQADLVVTSTQHEIETSYKGYEACPRINFRVIPPGIDVDRFYPYYHDLDGAFSPGETIVQARVEMRREISRFLNDPGKPLILAISRPDQRKNISGLISAFGEDKELRHLANLAIFAGVRKDITQMDDNERGVLTEMLLLMDKYDLYGKLAMPKKHDPEVEIPVLYRIAAASRGVFVNPALTENFGLTLIEAGSSGLPAVSTSEGGPKEIIERCGHGLLVDTADTGEISRALKRILVDEDRWQKLSKNGIEGVRRHYSWSAHVASYLEAVRGLKSERRESASAAGPLSASCLSRAEWLLMSDIDHTLIPGEEGSDQWPGLLSLRRALSNQEGAAFGLATGRSLELVREALRQFDIPPPDVVVCSVGTEIYYGTDLVADRGYRQHVSYRWKPDAIRECLEGLEFLRLQEGDNQRDFKVSYYMEEGDRVNEVRRRLRHARLLHNLVYSHGLFLDVLPVRASKGRAIRYLSRKWGIPPERIAVAGDSGNDEEMIRGEFHGIVVGNHSGDLDHLKGGERVFFANRYYGDGIVEGLRHFGLLEKGV